MGCRSSLLLSLALLAAPVAAQDGPTERSLQLEQLVAKALTDGDRTPSEVYYRIAEGRDAQAFSSLKEALLPLRDPGSLRSAYGACTLFKDSAIEESVRNWLFKQIFKAEDGFHQQGATLALTYFWRTSESELLRVLQGHPSKACRALALEPLLPSLVVRGDRVAARWIVENAELTARSRAALHAALRSFTGQSAETYLASALRSRSTSRPLRLMLLEVFAERDSEVARMAIERQLEDADEEVRLKALDILARGGDPEVHARLRRVAQRGSPDFVIAAMLSLAEKREGDPAWINELYAYTQSQSLAVRLGAASALGRLPTQDALRLLHRLMKDDEIEVQLAALEQIGARRQLQSVPKLIDALGNPRALVTHEVARQLRLLTGEDHGVSKKRWQAWFADQGASLQLPTVEEVLAKEKARADRKSPDGKYRTASFYGLEIQENKVCFVLDTSGSMADRAGGRGTSSSSRNSTRLAVAKQELADSLNQLLDGVEFNIITFSSGVSAYKKELIRLDGRSRAKALTRIERWYANGGTALYDGLVSALRDKKVGAIYLLTDGEPTEGRIVEPNEIRARIAELTRYRDVKIHGISIGRRSRLLKNLARDSGGQYVEIF